MHSDTRANHEVHVPQQFQAAVRQILNKKERSAGERRDCTRVDQQGLIGCGCRLAGWAAGVIPEAGLWYLTAPQIEQLSDAMVIFDKTLSSDGNDIIVCKVTNSGGERLKLVHIVFNGTNHYEERFILTTAQIKQAAHFTP